MVVVECFYPRAPVAIERMSLEIVPPQRMRPVANAEPPIEMLVHHDAALREAAPQRGGGQLQREPRILDRVVVGDRPVVLHREDAIQVGAGHGTNAVPCGVAGTTQCRRW